MYQDKEKREFPFRQLFFHFTENLGASKPLQLIHYYKLVFGATLFIHARTKAWSPVDKFWESGVLFLAAFSHEFCIVSNYHADSYRIAWLFG